MPTSSAVVTTSKMELTPMRVSFGPVGSEIDLGGTLANVSVSMKYGKAEIKADQSGDTVRDRRVNSTEITVTTEIAEIRDKDLWKIVFPHAHLVDGGLSGKSMYFTANIGDSDLANAKSLILHPLSKADADKSGDYKFFKAVSSAESEITYGPGEQARLKIVWNILPDDSVQPERFFIHGDPTIGVVAAAAGTPALTGTGNGTMTGVSVFSGFTVTETITAVCVHPVTNGGVFSVSGSVSGPLGLATVGVAFVSDVIAFTINDGGTDFALNDTWTVATTAANYV